MAAGAAVLMTAGQATSLLFATPGHMLTTRAPAAPASRTEAFSSAADTAGSFSYKTCASTLLVAAALLGLNGRASATGSSLVKKQRLRLVARKAEEGEEEAAAEEAPAEEEDSEADEAAKKAAEKAAKAAEEAAKAEAKYEEFIKPQCDAGQLRFEQAEAARIAAMVEREKMEKDVKYEAIRKAEEEERTKNEKQKADNVNFLLNYTRDEAKIAQLEQERSEKKAKREAEREAEAARKAQHEAEGLEIAAAKKAAKEAEAANEVSAE